MCVIGFHLDFALSFPRPSLERSTFSLWQNVQQPLVKKKRQPLELRWWHQQEITVRSQLFFPFKCMFDEFKFHEDGLTQDVLVESEPTQPAQSDDKPVGADT